MTNASLARFVCPDDHEARSAFERYLDRVRDKEHAPAQSHYDQNTASRSRLEYFTTAPRMEHLA